jgi:antagonist of KipI
MLMTVQDAGRRGFRKDGVSICGALDNFALRVANILVGNPQCAPLLEITLANASLHFHADSLIAICGGDLAPHVNDDVASCWRPLFVKANSTLHFRTHVSGCRAYLAVAGGLDIPYILESYSTDLRARIGGYEGRALRTGDQLRLRTLQDENNLQHKLLVSASTHKVGFTLHWFVSNDARPLYQSRIVRAVRGAKFTSFDERSREDFFAEEFIVTPQANRMAYRLRGCKLKLSQPTELLSFAVAPGTIQVPPDGNPLLLLADCQTTGGYPVIAHVATVDLPIIAQMRPGDSLRFSEISLEEAHHLFVKRENVIAELEYAVKLKLV